MKRRIPWRAWIAPTLISICLVAFASQVGATSRLASPVARPQPSQLVLDTASVGKHADAQTFVVTVHNQGNTTRRLYGVALSPDSAGFSIADPLTLPIDGERVDPQQTKHIRVQYQPTPGRRQAYGALLVYSDDPSGQDDPRTPARDFVHSLPLCAGESSLAVWLILLPLACGGLATIAQWRSRRRSRPLRAWVGIPLLLLGALPLLLLGWAAHGFVPEFGVTQGNYGYQFVWQRVLVPSLGLVFHAGLDGLSLVLALFIGLWALLRGILLAASQGQPPVPPLVVSQPASIQRGLAWLPLQCGAALALLVSLDVVPLLLSLAVLLWAVGAQLPLGQRRPFAVAAALGLAVWVAGLAWLVVHSQPTLLGTGAFVEYTTDLVKLSYQNYFADRPLLSAWAGGPLGAPAAPFLYVLLLFAALAPMLTLAVLSLRSSSSSPAAHAALSALPPIAIAGVYVVIRVLAGILPQAHAVLAPSVAALALLVTAAATLPSIVRRAFPAEPRVPLLPLLLPLSGVWVGLASATSTGILAALLLLGGLCLSCTWLGHRLSRCPNRGLCRPECAPDSATETEPSESPALRVALLLWLAPPGTLMFVAHALVMLAAFASLRGLSLLYLSLWLVSQLYGVLSLRCSPPAPRGTRPSSALLTSGVVLLASALACFCTRPLFELGHTWSLDFISHTGHASAPPGPGLLARK